MLFHRKHFKFVFIGAGSSVFTMNLVGDILTEDAIESGHLALVDIDKILLEEVQETVASLVSHTGKKFTVSAHTDFRKALEGADFVLFTFAAGGYIKWKQDIEICAKHGALQSVGDTIGPGGIIRTLRTIPVAVDIAKKMESICPNAWIVNYCNPEGAVGLALQKYTKIRSFSLCHGTPDTANDLAKKVFCVEPERLNYRAAGVNHLTWFTQMTIDGEDAYPVLMEKLQKSGFAAEEPISTGLFKVFGLYPAPGDRHVGEFFPFYLKEKVLQEKDYRWKNNDFVVVERWRQESRDELDEIRQKNTGYERFLEGSGETATHFMRSLITGEISTEMVNLINRGYIENVSDDIIVEIPAYIDVFGLHPQKMGRLPDAIAAKCESLGREYMLMVEAAVTGSYEKALQAMFLDPIVANVDYPDALLQELITANLDALPSFWQKSGS